MQIFSHGWKQSIEKGLSHSTITDLGDTKVEMAYYADIYDNINNNNDEPYIQAEDGSIQEYKTRYFRKIQRYWYQHSRQYF